MDGRVVIPDGGDLHLKLIFDFHDSPYVGHDVGINQSTRLLSRYYWWPRMDEDIASYVRECHSCQTIKARQQKPSGLLNPLELPMTPWECVSLDFITSLPSTRRGYDAIMVVVDKLTKMVHIIPNTTTCTAVTVAELYRDHVFKLRGIPLKVVSDRDLRFTSAFITELCALVGARQAMSTPYHPQTDGQTERVNRVLEDTIIVCSGTMCLLFRMIGISICHVQNLPSTMLIISLPEVLLLCLIMDIVPVSLLASVRLPSHLLLLILLKPCRGGLLKPEYCIRPSGPADVAADTLCVCPMAFGLWVCRHCNNNNNNCIRLLHKGRSYILIPAVSLLCCSLNSGCY